MGHVVEPHSTPKTPVERNWNWHGDREAKKGDALIQAGGWDGFANAHAWYDPHVDPEHDPPREKRA
jgi:hypothetical protein